MSKLLKAKFYHIFRNEYYPNFLANASVPNPILSYLRFRSLIVIFSILQQQIYFHINSLQPNTHFHTTSQVFLTMESGVLFFYQK